MDMCSDTGMFTLTAVICLGFASDLVDAKTYFCWYRHEDYQTTLTVYCRSGCCRDYGEEEDICCFSWTVGVILGVCFAAVTFVVILVLMVLCCYRAQKKRNRTGAVVSASQTHQSTIYTDGSARFTYPHPPSAMYPTSKFPNTLHAFGQPPSYSSANLYPPSMEPGASETSDITSSRQPLEPVLP